MSGAVHELYRPLLAAKRPQGLHSTEKANNSSEQRIVAERVRKTKNLLVIEKAKRPLLSRVYNTIKKVGSLVTDSFWEGE